MAMADLQIHDVRQTKQKHNQQKLFRECRERRQEKELSLIQNYTVFAKVRSISLPGKGENTAFLTKTGQLTYLQDDFSSGVWTTCIEQPCKKSQPSIMPLSYHAFPPTCTSSQQ